MYYEIAFGLLAADILYVITIAANWLSVDVLDTVFLLFYMSTFIQYLTVIQLSALHSSWQPWHSSYFAMNQPWKLTWPSSRPQTSSKALPESTPSVYNLLFYGCFLRVEVFNLHHRPRAGEPVDSSDPHLCSSLGLWGTASEVLLPHVTRELKKWIGNEQSYIVTGKM